MRGCNGICVRYKVKRPPGVDWDSGVKWCGTCEDSLAVEGFICPCCKSRLRTNSKSKKKKDNHARY